MRRRYHRPQRPPTQQGVQGPKPQPPKPEGATPPQGPKPLPPKPGPGQPSQGPAGGRRQSQGQPGRGNQGRGRRRQGDQERSSQNQNDQSQSNSRQNNQGLNNQGPNNQGLNNQSPNSRGQNNPSPNNPSPNNQGRRPGARKQGQARQAPRRQSLRPALNAPPIQREGGIRARSQRGAFATNWWAARWISALERVVATGRLNRGRTYAREGQVLSLDEIDGAVHARVQGTRPRPYKVTIKLKPLTDRQWNKVIDALAGQALFAAQLLAGEMPQEIDAVFAAAGCSLFPTTEGELETECSCPDWANPCKHVAAAHYILGEQLDEDPFLLFRLRGRSQEQVMAALRSRRSDAPQTADQAPSPSAEAAPPLDADLGHFWRMGGAAGAENPPLQVSIKPPATPLPLLKRLGQPPFLDEAIEQVLGPAYRGMQQAALAAAFESAE